MSTMKIRKPTRVPRESSRLKKNARIVIKSLEDHNQTRCIDGAVRQTSPSISIHMTAIFYGVTKERHSVRAASRLSLNVLRFESDLCELNRL
jgi:hypothetical protein